MLTCKLQWHDVTTMVFWIRFVQYDSSSRESKSNRTTNSSLLILLIRHLAVPCRHCRSSAAAVLADYCHLQTVGSPLKVGVHNRRWFTSNDPFETQTPIRVVYSDTDFSRCSPEPLQQRSGKQLMTPGLHDLDIYDKSVR